MPDVRGGGIANAKIGKRAVSELRKLLQNTPHEVLGHIESSAVCCRVGTVAIVKVDLVSYPAPKTKSPGK